MNGRIDVQAGRGPGHLRAYRTRLAKALGLLMAAERLRVLRAEAMSEAERKLGVATCEAVDAREAAEAAGETVIEAALLVARVRDGRP